MATTPRSRAAWVGLLLTRGPAARGVRCRRTGWMGRRRRAPRNASPHEVPPLHGFWQPKLFGPGTLPAVAGRPAGLAVRRRPGRAAALAPPARWRRTPGRWPGCSRWPSSTGPTASRGCSATRTSTSGPRARSPTCTPCSTTYVDRIPYSAADNWPTHVGRPPAGGAAVLRRAGAGRARRRLRRRGRGDRAGRDDGVAVLVTLRALGAEAAARRAAPFLVLDGRPRCSWRSRRTPCSPRSTAWGLACLALAPPRAAGRWSVLAGLLLGCGVLMSYGMPLMGLLALAVLVAGPVVAAPAGRGRCSAGGGAGLRRRRLRVVGRLPGARERYWDGIAQDRPAAYWMVGRPGLPRRLRRARCCGAGLAAAVDALARRRRPGRAAARRRGRGRVVALADLSRMSKAEVERIWLPFVPWLTAVDGTAAGAAGGAGGWRSRWSAALVVQHLLYTTW